MVQRQATIGDALIFLTKALLGGALLVAFGLIGGWYWMLSNDAIRAQHKTAEEQIVLYRVQNSALRGRLATLEHAMQEAGLELPEAWTPPDPPDRPMTAQEFETLAPTGAELKAVARQPGKLVRDESIPAPPPGFVIEEE